MQTSSGTCVAPLVGNPDRSIKMKYYIIQFE
jgi:hypothetical protein